MPRFKPQGKEAVALPLAGTAAEPASPGLQDALDALLATGMLRWDALLALKEAGVAPAELPLPQGVAPDLLLPVDGSRGWEAFYYAIRLLGGRDPAAANATLNAYLEGRTLEGSVAFTRWPKLTSLPPGLVVNGFLALDGTGLQALPDGLVVRGYLDLCDTPIASLPERLTVEGDLHLEWVPHLVTLPKGLKVANDLIIRGCPKWDGRIPDDAEVGNRIATDRHPVEISLPEWRRLHSGGVIPIPSNPKERP
jgi:hypothetical protein